MNPVPRLPTERELFDAAESLPADEATAFLRENCPDSGVRARIMALLASARGTEAEEMLPDEPANWPPMLQEETPGELVGRFRLERIIGQGGFGVVWLAQQQEPVQRAVAVKILKAGLDTRAVMARFAAERQALAMMDHPNVAHVYDAGATSAGRPYFVMEYLEGEPLFTYAASRRLTVAARLTLMGQAAAAVQHAHEKGIIHRDLKPSNLIVVEVDGGAVVKVIDFGIAKIVSADPAADITLSGQRWGTPAYMSPEQLAGADADTRTDVYALGVILYELICGAPVAANHIANGRNPAPPSQRITRMEPGESRTAAEQRSTEPRQLARLLRGDLDWIVMKAAAVEPAQRYDSAGALREDLRRFLANEAVSAGPPGTWYRTRKLIGRHKVKFAAAAASAAALMAGTLVSLNYARKARDAADAMSDALFDARMTGARAVRQSARPGQRVSALDSVAAAAALRATPELRDEALAAMSLPDVITLASMDVLAAAGAVMDYDFVSDLLVVGRHDHPEVRCFRLTTGEVLPPLPVLDRSAGSFKICLSPGGGMVGIYPNQPGSTALPNLTFYDTRDGRSLFSVPDAEYECDGCEFFGDGKIAVPVNAEAIAVINQQTGVEERRIATGGRINQVKADVPGRRLLACRSGEPTVLVLDILTGSILQTFTGRQPGIVAAFSPDERLAAFGDSGGSVYAADFLSVPDSPFRGAVELHGHSSAISSVSFVLDGQILVTGSWDNTVRLWSPGGGLYLSLEAGEVHAAPDGRRLLVRQGKRLQLLELTPAPECRSICQAPPVQHARAAFSPDGKRFAIITGSGTLVSTWPEARPVVQFSGPHRGIAFGHDSKRLYTSGTDGLRVWDISGLPVDGTLVTLPAAKGALIAEGSRGLCSVSSDGRWLASTIGHDQAPEERKISVFSLPSIQPAGAPPWTSASVESLIFDPAGAWMAASWWRGKGFSVYESTEWKTLTVCEPDSATMRIAVSRDGRHAASCSSSEMCLWDTARWEPVRRWSHDPISDMARTVAFSPAGDLIACGIDFRRIRLLATETGAIVATLTLPLKDDPVDLLFSPDGNTLAAAASARTWLFDLQRMREHLGRLGLAFGR